MPVDGRPEGDPLGLRERLLEGEPERIALIGVDAAEWAEEGAGEPGRPPRWLRFDSLADCARASPEARGADVALLSLEATAGDGALERTLGTACRLFPARLLLLVEARREVPAAALYAFGFRRLALCPEATLHEYRLRDYKQPPEWLNARFWANPARFADEPEDEEYEDEEEGGDDEPEPLDGTDVGEGHAG